MCFAQDLFSCTLLQPVVSGYLFFFIRINGRLTITYRLPEKICMPVYLTQNPTDTTSHKHIDSRLDFIIKLNRCAV